ARATADLMAIAAALNRPEDIAELRTMKDRLEGGLAGRWRQDLRRFVSLDLISGQDIEAPTQAGFIPLIAVVLGAEQKAAVAAEISRWCEDMVVGVPSTAPFSPLFEPKRYWRGPVWAVVNWLIADGLRTNGLIDLAKSVEGGTVKAMERAGFC
ncbi:neutral trehalase, partial [Corallococcus exiguus]|uniref:MGH1-like glycoside hydrolase domain-containing protein n=1 Tax=Corallococcus exiguus TaxID=83462 RepID=UPI0017D1A470